MNIEKGDCVVVNEEADDTYSYTDVGSVGRVYRVNKNSYGAAIYFYTLTGHSAHEAQGRRWSVDINHLTYLGNWKTTKEQALALAKLIYGRKTDEQTR